MPIDPSATNPFSSITTERLELSFGDESDAHELFPHLHGAAGRAVTDTILWDGPASPDELAGYFSHHATGTFGDHGFHWLLRDRTGDLTGEAGRPIGSIGLRSTDRPDVADFGYWLAPEWWGMGLMSEALGALIALAFDHWRYRAVEAEVFDHNAAGRALVGKLGFEPVESKTVTKRGREVPETLYRLEAPQ